MRNVRLATAEHRTKLGVLLSVGLLHTCWSPLNICDLTPEDPGSGRTQQTLRGQWVIIVDCLPMAGTFVSVQDPDCGSVQRHFSLTVGIRPLPESLSVGSQLLDSPPLNPVQGLARGSQPLVTGNS